MAISAETTRILKIAITDAAAATELIAAIDSETAEVAADLAFTPDGDIAASTVQTAIVEVRDDTDTKIAALVGTDIGFTPAGDIAATTVETAIVEVRDDTDSKLAALGAGDIGFTPAGDIAATDVQAAIVEVRDEAQTKAQDSGSIPSAAINIATDPSATNTLTIGADVYEFVTAAGSVASDTNIAVVRGAGAAAARTALIAAINATSSPNEHASIFLLDGLTPALANGTENLLADEVGTTVRIRSADAPGGSVVAADPSIVLAEALTNAADIWNVGAVNLNTLAGKAAGILGHSVVSFPVTAAMITNGVTVEFPFTPTHYQVQVRTSAGIMIGTTSADEFVRSANGIVCTFGAGTAPDAQATDIVTIVASA